MSNDPNKFFQTYEIDKATLKKMQNKMLEMLLYFKDFCDQHGLRFSLLGGSAIGAVREHGFVPWDDDIDCIMPRPDYEKFPELWEKYGDKDRYVFCRSSREVNYHHASSSLRDPTTTFICTYNQNSDICHGIALEFGAIDAVPNSKILRAFQLFDGALYSLFNFQRLPNNKGKLIRTLTKIAYTLVPSKNLRDSIWIAAQKRESRYSWEKAKYVRMIGGLATFNLYPKEWFENYVYFDFEGYPMPLMSGYDEFLRGIFGDYMKRPPEKDRVAKHDLIYVDMDHPYTDYRNIYYFPENDPRNKRKKK